MKKSNLLIVTVCILAFVLMPFVLFGCGDDTNGGDSAGRAECSVRFTQAAAAEDGYATVYAPEGRALKVMLLADPQTDSTEKYSIVGTSNEKTYALIEAMLKSLNPDLVLIAGDMAMCSVNNNWKYFDRYASIFETYKMPWAFLFGNHDCENFYANAEVTTTSKFMQLTKENLLSELRARYSYLLTTVGDCEDGVGNNFINVRNGDGELLYTFAMFDTLYDGNMDYLPYLSNTQVEWYAENIDALSDEKFGENRDSSQIVKSTAVMHVGIPEFYTAWKEAFDGLGNPIDGKYFYGQLLAGNYSEYDDSTDFFETAVELGSTENIFYGHHHDNDASVMYEGIRLTFLQHSGLSHNYRTPATGGSVGSWTGFDFSDLDNYGDKRGCVMLTVLQDESGVQTSFAPQYASEVIPNYASTLAIDVEAVVAALEADTSKTWDIVRGENKG